MFILKIFKYIPSLISLFCSIVGRVQKQSIILYSSSFTSSSLLPNNYMKVIKNIGKKLWATKSLQPGTKGIKSFPQTQIF